MRKNIYRTPLRRIPDDVILSMATRWFIMAHPEACVCGWAIYEDLIAATGAAPFTGSPKVEQCVSRFGGSESEWYQLFYDVCDPDCLPLIETAFVQRVAEAVYNEEVADAHRM